MTAPAHTRRTSVYTIRLQEPTPGLVEEVTRMMRRDFLPVIDVGDASVSFRSTGDARALADARDVMAGMDDPWELTTGLGVHRRTVTP